MDKLIISIDYDEFDASTYRGIHVSFDNKKIATFNTENYFLDMIYADTFCNTFIENNKIKKTYSSSTDNFLADKFKN